jgi:AbrB family looped-hinge helix DNA binding protein
MKAVVSEKGQVTIPKKIRRRLGILPGTVMDFEAQGGRLVAKKTDGAEDVVRAMTVWPLDTPPTLRGKASKLSRRSPGYTRWLTHSY